MDRIRRLFSRFRRFIDEAWSELKKVSWPTIPQTRNLTVLVLAVSFAVGLFMMLLVLAIKIALVLLVIYFIIRLVSPETARRLRERWSGPAA